MKEKDDNTTRSYKTAMKQFQEGMNLSLDDIRKLPEKELSNQIDKFVKSLSIEESSKLTRLSAIRSAIEKETDKQLPKSKIRASLSASKLRYSNKEELSTEEINAVIDFFHKEYKQAKEKKNSKLIPGLRNYILVRLLSFTGQRIGDILSLKVSTAKNQTLTFKQEKTGEEVFIDNPSLSEINLYIQALSLADNDYLFASGIRREPISYTQIYKIIQIAGLKLFQREITPHSFRKYTVVKLRKEGMADHDIRRVTGHSTTGMLDYYQGKDNASVKNLTKILTSDRSKKGKVLLATKRRGKR